MLDKNWYLVVYIKKWSQSLEVCLKFSKVNAFCYNLSIKCTILKYKMSRRYRNTLYWDAALKPK